MISKTMEWEIIWKSDISQLTLMLIQLTNFGGLCSFVHILCSFRYEKKEILKKKKQIPTDVNFIS